MIPGWAEVPERSISILSEFWERLGLKSSRRRRENKFCRLTFPNPYLWKYKSWEFASHWKKVSEETELRFRFADWAPITLPSGSSRKTVCACTQKPEHYNRSPILKNYQIYKPDEHYFNLGDGPSTNIYLLFLLRPHLNDSKEVFKKCVSPWQFMGHQQSRYLIIKLSQGNQTLK